MEREPANSHADVRTDVESLDNVPDSKPHESVGKHHENTGFDERLLVHRFVGDGYVIQAADFVKIANLIPKDAMGTYEPFWLLPDNTEVQA